MHCSISLLFIPSHTGWIRGVQLSEKMLVFSPHLVVLPTAACLNTEARSMMRTTRGCCRTPRSESQMKMLYCKSQMIVCSLGPVWIWRCSMNGAVYLNCWDGHCAALNSFTVTDTSRNCHLCYFLCLQNRCLPLCMFPVVPCNVNALIFINIFSVFSSAESKNYNRKHSN